jgi:DNA-binding NtrC family response regulator
MTSTGPTAVVRAGQHDTTAELEADIACAARCDTAVLISGDAGSGHELIAKLIHEKGVGARRRPFVAINCADVADDALQSKLVAHTPASATRAWRGTVLLLEVSAISARIQDVLFELLGSGLDSRLIATTSRGLYADVVAGRFREDLYYRLNVIHVRIPPSGDNDPYL